MASPRDGSVTAVAVHCSRNVGKQRPAHGKGVFIINNNEIINELSAEDLEKVFGGKKQVVRAGKGGINIHALPGENEPVVAQTSANSIANYTGEMVFVKGAPWIKVSWGGKSGWILAKYVQKM